MNEAISILKYLKWVHIQIMIIKGSQYKDIMASSGSSSNSIVHIKLNQIKQLGDISYAV